MSFIKKHEMKDKKKKVNKKIDAELPFFITMVTLLATSGFGPYTIFKKIKDLELLPNVRIESIKILKKIDILGKDPLTVMAETNLGGSSGFGEFLSGWVSTIQSGGDVVNYLKTKMDTAFELYEAHQKELAGRVQTLVETYMTMQIIVLAIYIIITVTSTGSASAAKPDDINPIYVVVIMPPAVSFFFLIIAHKLTTAKIKELDWKKILMFGIPGILAAVTINALNILPDYNLYILAGGLIVSAIWPALKFRKIYAFSIDAESATSLIMRDVAEARKAGLGPEKCVIRSTKRKDFGLFNKVANGIANKLEWGMGLDNIFKFIKKEVTDFQILINFKVLFEIISAGGGNVNTLDTLANISEKIRSIEKTKREMLQPYVMVGFMLIAITSFTTLLVIDSLTSLDTQLEIDDLKKEELAKDAKSSFDMLGMAILIQSWIAGLFLGKITTGSYSGGFMYSIFLVVISIGAIAIISLGIFNVAAIYS